MYNSTTYDVNGHGVQCSICRYIGIKDSIFENLTSALGAGAIELDVLLGPQDPYSFIQNSQFIGNEASSGGALILNQVNELDISGNRFDSNKALDKKDGDGGAILYKCDPTTIKHNCTVALFNNTFVKNEASRKGGALRYENDNFIFDKVFGNTDSGSDSRLL